MGVVTGGGGGTAFNGGTITRELDVIPSHDTGTGTVEIIAKGDDYPTRLLFLGTRHGTDPNPTLVWSFQEDGQATLGPASIVDVGGGWILEPYVAGSTPLQARHAADEVDETTDIFEARKADGSLVYWVDGTGTAEYRMGVGASFHALDHNFAQIFRIGEDGSVTVAIPAADPHVVGALYSVAGVVHVSAG